jgi:DNA-binding transcriptional regulator YhcF (GntR family)
MAEPPIAKWHIDRELPIPLHEQIKGQIVFAIIYGNVKPDAPLPSVRAMAVSLKVSTMTVSGVYRELVQEGLVVSRPRIGYFVAPTDSIQVSIHGRNTQRNLRQIIHNCVRRSLQLGYSAEEVYEVFTSIIDQYDPKCKPDTLVLVGNFMPATADYAAEIEKIIGDKKIKVVPVILSQIIEKQPQVMETIECASLVITIASRLQETRALLQSYPVRITAVMFDISLATRQRLSNISHDQTVGIVATYPEFLQTMIDQVVSYGFSVKPLLCAVMGQDERIHDMLSKIDVLVYASGSESVLNWVPKDVEAIELRHTPEPESVLRLFNTNITAAITG